jgi:TonB family protein
LIGELTEPEEDTQEIGEGITEQQQLVLPLSEAEIEFSARITTFSVLLSSVYDGIASLSLNSQDELESFNFDFLDSLRVETGYSQRWGISQDIYKQSLRDIWNASGTRLMIATIAGHQNSIDTFSEQGIDLALIDRQLTELSLAEYKFKLFLASFSSFLDLPDVNPVEPTTPPKIEYPRRAQQRQLEGSAKLEFAIGVDGQVIEDSIQIQSTNSAFDEPSLEVISLYAYHQSEIPDYVANEMPAEWRDRIKLFGLTLAFTYALP